MTEIQTEEIPVTIIEHHTPMSSMTAREYMITQVFSAMVRNGNYNAHQAVYATHDLIRTMNSVYLKAEDA
jgi:hypothetical protein